MLCVQRGSAERVFIGFDSKRFCTRAIEQLSNDYVGCQQSFFEFTAQQEKNKL
jgi:hypothetical protein